jgi:hypothetical protein
MSTNGNDKSERIRIRCSAATESGVCRDAKTFYLTTVESAVLAGLEAAMRHPSMIAEYVRTYHDERKRLSARANAKRAYLELRLCLHRKTINISAALAGQRLGIKEVDEGIWLVSFMHYDLGYFDLEQRTLQPPRQRVRHEVVTHVLGTWCYLSVRAGQGKDGRERASRYDELTFFNENNESHRAMSSVSDVYDTEFRIRRQGRDRQMHACGAARCGIA